MKAIVLARAPHQFEIGGAFAEGLRRHGWQVSITNSAGPCDLLVCWGIRRTADIQQQKRRGGEVCVLERGYLGDRFRWSSVSFGGELNGRAEFRGVSSASERFERNFGHLMQPWRKTDADGYALLIGQVPGDMSLRARGGNIDGWYRDAAKALAGAGLDVRFRPHPQAVKRGFIGAVAGAPTLGGSLQDAFAGASRVVTFNSNTAVESVLAGVPTVVADEGSMAWPVTSHSIGGGLIAPDRGEWASRLAWKQWRNDELASGECWARVSTDMVEAA